MEGDMNTANFGHAQCSNPHMSTPQNIPTIKIICRAIFSILAFITTQCSLRSEPIVVWSKDATNGFKVTECGYVTGFGEACGYASNFISPSGLWNLNIGGFRLSSEDPYKILSVDAVYGDYTGPDPFWFATDGGYGTAFEEIPETSGNDFIFQPSGWSGAARLDFVSASDLNDISTYQYVLTVHLEGPNKIPEATNCLILMLIGIAAAVSMRRQTVS
jgi:hypothetical protein